MIYVLDPATRTTFPSSQCELEGPCFLATITSIHTGMRNRAAIVRCAYELQRYFNAAADVIVEGVQMLCPPNLTGRTDWSLEDLLQIVCFRGVETDDSAVVYTTSAGTYKLGELDLRRKKTCHVWYSRQRLSAHIPQASKRILDLSEPYVYGKLI